MDTVAEWSKEFDLEYDNITSGKAPGLVSYEKSYFLTKGEENVVIGLYRGTLTAPFESTEEVTSYLASLVTQASMTEAEAQKPKLSDKSRVFKIGSSYDVLFVTLEECKIRTPMGEKLVQVIPVTQDEYWRTVRNPYKKQNANRVLRLSYTDVTESAGTISGETRYSELISDCHIVEYTVRYLKRPEPIILEALSGNLKINGEQAVKTCKLPKAIHRLILAEAVRLAKAAWNS